MNLALVSIASVQGKDVGTPLELRVRGHDGWRLVEMIGAPFGDAILVSLRDLTERRRWEVAGNEIERVPGPHPERGVGHDARAGATAWSRRRRAG